MPQYKKIHLYNADVHTSIHGTGMRQVGYAPQMELREWSTGFSLAEVVNNVCTYYDRRTGKLFSKAIEAGLQQTPLMAI
jgi:hypothetical protein